MAAKKPGTGKANIKAKAPAKAPVAAKATPAAKTLASKPPSAKPAPVKGAKPTAPVAKASGTANVDRQRLIAETAYFLAQSRGFQPGNALDDWLAAERSVDARLRG